jgi:hypothetical protein
LLASSSWGCLFIMAVYKVIQDIESEDKIVGFLTFRTFVYALIAGALIYINLRFLMANILGPLRFVFVFILIWPMFLFALLAAPLGGEQSTEVWILAHVRFYLKPRVRIWNQSGILELVTVTAPKRIERQLTKNLTQREVRSRLKALATTLDSRGWAVRNVAVNLNTNPSYLDIVEPESDRLSAGSNLPATKAATDITESDDIMDSQNNPTAQHFEALMQQEDEKRKKKVTELITNTQPAPQAQAQQPSPDEEDNVAPDFSILDKITGKGKETTSFVSHSIVAPGSETVSNDKPEVTDPELAAAEQAYIENERKLSAEVHAKSAGFKPPGRVIVPEVNKTAVQPAPTPPKQQAPEPAPQPIAPALTATPNAAQAPMTNNVQNANLKELSQSGNDLSVASVQKLANRNSENIRQISPNEVEIDFHSR